MLKTGITPQEIKKIFQNNGNKIEYLKRYFVRTGNTEAIESAASKIDDQIISTWDYDISKEVIREMFIDTDKYKYISKCSEKIDAAIKEWNEMGLGDFAWPFSAMGFDQHIHTINRNEKLTEKQKDDLVSRETIIFRRIKHINALRNDYIEFLVFQNDNVIPTFGNNRGVDFYIDGMPYDQKVAKSVGAAFKRKYGDKYRDIAIDNPALVAVSMYENQDEERFGDEPRLLIVYLDSDVTSQKIEEQLSNIDFTEPLQIEFKFNHSNNTLLTHKTKCFVVLLHN